MKNREKAAQKGRKIKILHILILLLVTVVLVIAFFRINVSSKLQLKLDAVRSAGYPVTLEELDEWYSIPMNVENSAYFVLDAVDYFKEPNEQSKMPVIGGAELPVRKEAMDDEIKEKISLYLNENQKCLELLHKTAGLKYGRYPVDFKMGNAVLLPHLSLARRYVQLLKLEAVLAAENDIPDTALHSIKSIFGVSGSMGKEPLIVSQLVRFACQSLGVSSIEYTLNRIDLSDEQIMELNVLLEEIENSKGLQNAMFGERVMTLDMLMHPNPMYLDLSSANNSSSLISFRPVLFIYKVAGLSESDSIVLFNYTDNVIKAFKLPPYQRQTAAKALDIEINEIPKKHALLRKFIPSYGGLIRLDLRSIAYLRATRTALAVQRYRLKNKTLPDSLDNLVPDYLESIPLDPFDGKVIRIKKLDKGFVVYSIGEDRIDDGGKEQSKNNKNKNDSSYDITFIIER